MPKPTLLYVTPVVPRLTGSGIAMRASAHVRALATLFDVTLAIVSDGEPESALRADIPDALSSACGSIVVATKQTRFGRLFERLQQPQLRVILEAVSPLPMPYGRLRSASEELAQILAGRHFDIVHCFRLSSASAILTLRRHAVAWQQTVLDLDDYESRAAMRSVRHASADLGRQLRFVRTLGAAKWHGLESRIVPRFDNACVCSESDRAILGRRFRGQRWIVLPNIVPEPPGARPPDDPLRKFTFLFVGQLNYPPNRDGVLFFCRSVLPLLRSGAPAPFSVLIVGRQPDPEIRALADSDGIEVIADPPEVTPYYARGDVAVVPLRTGGGTRIKIIEAFSYGVPVVSTTVGAEGLEAVPGRDLLIADSAPDFADQCRRLMSDAARRHELARAGLRLFRGNFTPEALLGILRSRYPGRDARDAAARGKAG